MKLKAIDSVEKSVVGAMITDPVLYDSGIKHLTVDHFTGQQAQIFSVIKELHNEGNQSIDIIAVDAKLLKKDVHVTELMAICSDFCHSTAFDQHVKILKERRSRKQAINLSLQLQNSLIDENKDIADSIKAFTEQSGDAVEDKTGIDNYNHYKSIEGYLGVLEKGMRDGSKMKGVSSHLPDLDRVINGFQHGLTYVIGGLKKTGKSRFALDLVSGFLNQHLCGIVFSLEMAENKIHDCIFANRLRINTGKFGTSGLSQEEYAKIMQECNNYTQQNFHISRKSRIEPEYVRDYIRHVSRKTKVDFVVIDYIQRMKGRGESRTKEVEYCATTLADIGRDENVIMIFLSQLSGAAESNNGKSPIYSFYKESQAIIEAADTVITLNDPNRGKEGIDENYKELDAIILQRDGVSDVWVKLHAELQYSKFNCITRREE